MPEETTSATGGQAPAGDGANAGQAPQANNNGSGNPAPAGQVGQAPNGNTQQQQQQWSQADYERIIADLRRENAGHRTENARVAGELKKFQDAQLSDAEKAARRLAELEQTNTTQARELTELKLTRAIERASAALNIIDADAAAKLLDWAEIDFDSSGAPKNLDKLLTALVAAKPWLVGAASAQSQRPPAANSGGATNPGRSAGNGGLTLDIIRAMPMRERMARIDEITAWEKAQARQQN